MLKRSSLAAAASNVEFDGRRFDGRRFWLVTALGKNNVKKKQQSPFQTGNLWWCFCVVGVGGSVGAECEELA